MKKELIFIIIISFALSLSLGFSVNFIRHGRVDMIDLIVSLLGGFMVSAILTATFVMAGKYKK